jgi:hypothetical protein
MNRLILVGLVLESGTRQSAQFHFKKLLNLIWAGIILFSAAFLSERTALACNFSDCNELNCLLEDITSEAQVERYERRIETSKIPAYPRRYYLRAKAIFDRANSDPNSNTFYRNLAKIGLIHARYMYARTMAEQVKETVSTVTDLSAKEKQYFELINNQRVKLNIQSHIRAVDQTLVALRNTSELRQAIEPVMESYLREQKNLKEQIEVLEWKMSLKEYETSPELSQRYIALAAEAAKLRQILFDYAQSNHDLTKRFVFENFEALKEMLMRDSIKLGFDKTGAVVVSTETLWQAIRTGQEPLEPQFDLDSIGSAAGRQKLHEEFLTAGDLNFLRESTQKFDDWIKDPVNFENTGELVRIEGESQPMDNSFKELYRFLNNPKEVFESMIDFEKDVLVTSRKYGIGREDAARVVLLAYEKAEGFTGLTKLDSFVIGASWGPMVKSKVMFRDYFFVKGDTHGRDTHRVQMYLMARYSGPRCLDSSAPVVS